MEETESTAKAPTLFSGDPVIEPETLAFVSISWVFWSTFQIPQFKNRQMIGGGAGEEVWVSGFKWVSSFCSLPISHTADVTRWEWSLSLFWFPSYNPCTSSLLPLGNLWSLQNYLTDNHSHREQAHTLLHWNSLTQELKGLVYNRFKYKYVFLPFITSSLLEDAKCDHILGGNTVCNKWGL